MGSDERPGISVRLSAAERDALIAWATEQVSQSAALRGRYFHINGRPKVSAILRAAALTKARES